MSCKFSQETYNKIRSYRPENLDDREYRSKVSQVLHVSEKNIDMVWVSNNFEDYLTIKDSDYKMKKAEIELLKYKSQDKIFEEALLKIGDSIVSLGEGLKQLVYAKRRENTNE